MMPDAEDAEAQLAQDIFGLFDLRELFGRHRTPVRNARRQARRCGLVPRRQSRAARELAHFILREIGIVERALHPEFASRLTAGTIVATVIGVAAVDDHAEALWVILTRGRSGQTYNVGGNNEWTNLAIVKRLIELVAQLKGRPQKELEAQIRFVKDRPGHDRRYAIDSSKLQQELGWSPRHDLETGLSETVRWYADNGAWVSGVRSGAYREWIDQNYGTRG